MLAMRQTVAKVKAKANDSCLLHYGKVWVEKCGEQE